MGLPDLDQNNEFVNETLNAWIEGVANGLQFNGVRLDSAAYVNRNFWGPFVNNLNMFGVADLFIPNNNTLEFLATYMQPQGPFQGVMNYPLFSVLRNIFANSSSMQDLQTFNTKFFQMFSATQINSMGLFIENHMFPRLLSLRNDINAYKNALAYVLLAQGIPFVYYGSEQGYVDQFLSLWPNYDHTSNLYQVNQKPISIRFMI